MASNLLAMASNLLAMASNLLAMASNLLAMASNLLAMASNLLALEEVDLVSHVSIQSTAVGCSQTTGMMTLGSPPGQKRPAALVLSR